MVSEGPTKELLRNSLAAASAADRDRVAAAAAALADLQKVIPAGVNKKVL